MGSKQGAGPLARSIFPLAVFFGVMTIHYLWVGYSPLEEAQSEWIEIDSNITLWQRYIAFQEYFLGYSYAFSFAFTAIAFRNYREKSFCNSSKFAIGGLGFSGGLAVAGCFLIGCCGSPMLVVYSSLFGMKYANLAKPFIAGITTLIIIGSWIWMRKRLVPVAVNDTSCTTTGDQSDRPCC